MYTVRYAVRYVVLYAVWFAVQYAGRYAVWYSMLYVVQSAVLTSLFMRMLASMLTDVILTEMLCSSLHLAAVSFLWVASARRRWLLRTCREIIIDNLRDLGRFREILVMMTCSVSRMLVTSATSSAWGESASSSGGAVFVLRQL